MATPAAAINATVIHPRMTIGLLAVNAPITFVRETSRIRTTISGTATSPLITALQNKARIGLIGEYWIANAASTLTAITP